MWEGLVNWSVLIVYGADALIYGALVTSGTLLFLIRIVFEFVGSTPRPRADAASAGPVRHVTLLSILGFFMGVGWLGLISRAEWQLRLKPSAAIAVAGGVACFLVASVLVSATRRQRGEVTEERHEDT